ncbi:MAG: 6-phosphogluconolactonase [Clostridia bacterium]|nr:6-phosphogluconolactonase [Clostridia bacterium]MBR0206056.1 6-phosphogluconolactonase [Clostridia bacterium]
MSVLVFSDAQTAAAAAATLLGGQLIEKPSLVMGLDCAAALTPAYHSLSAMTANGLLSWGKAAVYQLSERVREEGKPALRDFLDDAMLRELSLRPEQVVAPDDASDDWASSCHSFEDAILQAGGLDVALLTVGTDGSLLFNAPDGDIAPTTHVELYHGEKIVTAGLSTLMSAKKLIVLMTGQGMAETAQSVIRGAVNSTLPASMLQLHAAVTFLLDEEAASLLG